jgi:hypothetical protein
MLRTPVFNADGSEGELASLRWANGAIIAVRLNVGRDLTDWLDPATLTTRPTTPARP